MRLPRPDKSGLAMTFLFGHGEGVKRPKKYNLFYLNGN